MTKSNPLRTLFLLLALTATAVPASALTTLFTYQGRLLDSTLPPNAPYDFLFRIFDGNSVQIGRTLTNEDVIVTSGLFQVDLDFGPGVFTGAPRFLEISVRPGNVTNDFTRLLPRQPVNPVPYAMFAMMAQNASFATNAQTAANAENANTAQNAFNAQTAQNAILATNALSVNWANIAGIPADFADNVDNVVPYATGTGLVVTAGNTLNVLLGTNGASTSAARADHVHLGHGWTGVVSRGLSLVVSNSTGTNVGVWGQTDAATGAGVFGFGSSTNGTNYGVFGQTASARGIGVLGWATSTNGIGVQAQGTGGSNSIALAVANGGIRVRGAGVGTPTPVFLHRTAASNIVTVAQSVSVIDHPLCNGDPTAVLIVTPNYNPNDATGNNGVLNPYVVGVAYTGTSATYAPLNNRWAIFNLAGNPISAGASFNVLVVKP